MTKRCDHTSVGMLVWKENELLLIERKKPPFGFAPPAGHVDKDDSFEVAAKRELEEEVGLKVKNINLLIEGRKENPCRRKDGNWHYWKIYEIKTEGDVKRSQEETKQAGFYSKEKIKELAKRTEDYIKGEIKEEEWEKSPGIEPVWYEWLKELEVI
ncbi:NUDIX hydrolase [Patescibacteria group bacterium]|nr:NUDIX hydrolase [Patescibacteria group bacterium]